jgi:hypothetical protein
VGLYSLTELCILGGFPALSILRFPKLLLPSSSMHAAAEHFRLFACFGLSVSLYLYLSLSWVYPFSLLSLSGSGTASLLARWPRSTVTALTLSFCSSTAQLAEKR